MRVTRWNWWVWHLIAWWLAMHGAMVVDADGWDEAARTATTLLKYRTRSRAFHAGERILEALTRARMVRW